MEALDEVIKLNLRLDEPLHRQLTAQAKRSVRSLNGEIIFRLRRSNRAHSICACRLVPTKECQRRLRLPVASCASRMMAQCPGERSRMWPFICRSFLAQFVRRSYAFPRWSAYSIGRTSAIRREPPGVIPLIGRIEPVPGKKNAGPRSRATPAKRCV